MSETPRLTPAESERAGGFCPGARLRRNRWRMWIMAIGGLNLAAYPIVYGILGGDAHNGHRHVERAQTGEIVSTYFIRGHHLRSLAGREREVSRTVWVLSYAHSISLLLTSGAMVLAMLSFASPHILATMRGPRVRGQIFVGGLAVVVAVLSVGVAAFMIWDMTVQLMATPK